MRASDTQPWPDCSGAQLLGAQEGMSHGGMGLGEVGSDDQDFQPPWTPAGAVGPQNLRDPAMSFAHLEGASNGYRGV